MNNNTNPESIADLQLEQLPLAELELFELTGEQREVFMEVIGSALNIKHKTQLFRWTQGIFQYLIGHDVMIYATQTSLKEYRFQFLTSSRYFGQEQLDEIIAESGLLTESIHQWQTNRIPLFVTNALKEGVFKHYQVLNAPDEELADSELKDIVIHGFSNQSSLVIFGRLHKKPSAEMAHIVELLMPYMHNMISNMADEETGSISDQTSTSYKRLSNREVEIIKWVHQNKTNREISLELNISPLTVKNHVQNIIKKLSVKNRRQAAAKAFKLSLF